MPCFDIWIPTKSPLFPKTGLQPLSPQNLETSQGTKWEWFPILLLTHLAPTLSPNLALLDRKYSCVSMSANSWSEWFHSLHYVYSLLSQANQNTAKHIILKALGESKCYMTIFMRSKTWSSSLEEFILSKKNLNKSNWTGINMPCWGGHLKKNSLLTFLS